jgi:hypothetical protein
MNVIGAITGPELAVAVTPAKLCIGAGLIGVALISSARSLLKE